MIGRVSGVLLEAQDAEYLLTALDALMQDRHPTARLADFIERLRRTTVNLPQAVEKAAADGRKLGAQQDSGHTALYDLVDTGEAAAILGCSERNVRDLGDRGRLPRHRAGRGWVYPAASVVALAEKRAANRS